MKHIKQALTYIIGAVIVASTVAAASATVRTKINEVNILHIHSVLVEIKDSIKEIQGDIKNLGR